MQTKVTVDSANIIIKKFSWNEVKNNRGVYISILNKDEQYRFISLGENDTVLFVDLNHGGGVEIADVEIAHEFSWISAKFIASQETITIAFSN